MKIYCALAVIFILGKPLYRMTKPSGNMLMRVAKCIAVRETASTEE